MILLGAALGWKFNHEPGIRTKAGKLTGWPETLGSRPTTEETATIIQEYKNQIVTENDKKALLDNAKSLDELKQAFKIIIFGG